MMKCHKQAIGNYYLLQKIFEKEKVTIYEKDDCTPHVEEYTTYTKNKMNRILRMILAFGYGESSKKSYEIYIPTGTIFSNLVSQ